MSNITEVTFTVERYAVTAPLYQYDYGQVLKITAPSLPDPYTVHFGNARSCGESLTVIGTASDGAAIPSSLLATGLNVYAWVFLHTGENDGETEYMIEIPVIRRAEPTDDPVIEEDPSAVDIIMGEISSLKEEISELGGLSDDVKQALLQIAQKVAYVDDDGADYYQDLYDALYPPAEVVSISAVYTQSGTVYDTDTLDSLKADLVVTALYDDSTTETVTTYTLIGTLTEGTSTITVSYGGKTTTFNVTVSHASQTYTYNWDFTQSLEDSVQGAVLTLSGNATRDSSGLHLTSANDYVTLTGLNVTGNCIEIDVADYDRKGNSHARLLTIYQSGVASSGFIYHSTGDWAIYSKSASNWIDSNLPADGLDGKTVTVKLLLNEEQANKKWMYVLVDGEPLVDGNMSGTSTANAYLGSDNGQSAYNITITGLRVYQEA